MDRNTKIIIALALVAVHGIAQFVEASGNFNVTLTAVFILVHGVIGALLVSAMDSDGEE